MNNLDTEETEEHTQEELSTNMRIHQIAWTVIGVASVFLLGLGTGYLTWGQDETAESKQQREMAKLYD